MRLLAARCCMIVSTSVIIGCQFRINDLVSENRLLALRQVPRGHLSRIPHAGQSSSTVARSIGPSSTFCRRVLWCEGYREESAICSFYSQCTLTRHAPSSSLPTSSHSSHRRRSSEPCDSQRHQTRTSSLTASKTRPAPPSPQT